MAWPEGRFCVIVSLMVHTYSQLGELGRLGNQLWQIASTVGSASAMKDSVRFRGDWDYRPFFSLPEAWFRVMDDDGLVFDSPKYLANGPR